MFPRGGVSERSKRMAQLALDQFDESDDDYRSDDSYIPEEDHLLDSDGIYYMKYVNGRRTGLVKFYAETAFYNGLMKERYKGGIEVTGRQGRRCRKLLDDLKENERILSFEKGSSGSHYVESSLWKRLWTCHKTDY
jgi:hypothetical protein